LTPRSASAPASATRTPSEFSFIFPTKAGKGTPSWRTAPLTF
jgi:hypothetical protein